MKLLLLLLLMLGIAASSAAATPRRGGVSGGQREHVSGYYRKNGTYVHSHERASSGTGNRSSSSRTYRPSSRSAGPPPSRSRRSSGQRPAGTSGSESRGETKRSRSMREAFERSEPCPSTGKRSGDCPGYVVDHVKALACGGADSPSNMQWQTVLDAKEKDKTERIGCQ